MKKIKTIILASLLVLPAGSLVHAQGLYGNGTQKTAGSRSLHQETTANTNPSLRAGIDDDGEPKGDEAPVGEGLLLLAALAGARYTVKGTRKKMKNEE